jgi:hypothetical protein
MIKMAKIVIRDGRYTIEGEFTTNDLKLLKNGALQFKDLFGQDFVEITTPDGEVIKWPIKSASKLDLQLISPEDLVKFSISDLANERWNSEHPESKQKALSANQRAKLRKAARERLVKERDGQSADIGHPLAGFSLKNAITEQSTRTRVEVNSRKMDKVVSGALAMLKDGKKPSKASTETALTAKKFEYSQMENGSYPEEAKAICLPLLQADIDLLQARYDELTGKAKPKDEEVEETPSEVLAPAA